MSNIPVALVTGGKPRHRQGGGGRTGAGRLQGSPDRADAGTPRSGGKGTCRNAWAGRGARAPHLCPRRGRRAGRGRCRRPAGGGMGPYRRAVQQCGRQHPRHTGTRRRHPRFTVPDKPARALPVHETRHPDHAAAGKRLHFQHRVPQRKNRRGRARRVYGLQVRARGARGSALPGTRRAGDQGHDPVPGLGEYRHGLRRRLRPSPGKK